MIWDRNDFFAVIGYHSKVFIFFNEKKLGI